MCSLKRAPSGTLYLQLSLDKIYGLRNDPRVVVLSLEQIKPSSPLRDFWFDSRSRRSHLYISVNFFSQPKVCTFTNTYPARTESIHCPCCTAYTIIAFIGIPHDRAQRQDSCLRKRDKRARVGALRARLCDAVWKWFPRVAKQRGGSVNRGEQIVGMFGVNGCECRDLSLV